jgi:hypothetical protein
MLALVAALSLPAIAATLPIKVQFGPTAGGRIVYTNTTVALGTANPGALQSGVIQGPSEADYGGFQNLRMAFTNPSGGTYSISGVSGNSATVSGLGSVKIFEGVGGGSIIMDLQLIDLAYVNNQLILNTKAIFNLSNPNNYVGPSANSGTNILLNALKTNNLAYLTFGADVGSGYANLAAVLASVSNTQLSYTATLFVTPEPAFYGLLSIGMGGLFLIARRRRKSEN